MSNHTPLGVKYPCGCGFVLILGGEFGISCLFQIQAAGQKSIGIGWIVHCSRAGTGHNQAVPLWRQAFTSGPERACSRRAGGQSPVLPGWQCNCHRNSAAVRQPFGGRRSDGQPFTGRYGCLSLRERAAAFAERKPTNAARSQPPALARGRHTSVPATLFHPPFRDLSFIGAPRCNYRNSELVPR
jgi:hypothetical protein